MRKQTWIMSQQLSFMLGPIIFSGLVLHLIETPVHSDIKEAIGHQYYFSSPITSNYLFVLLEQTKNRRIMIGFHLRTR